MLADADLEKFAGEFGLTAEETELLTRRQGLEIKSYLYSNDLDALEMVKGRAVIKGQAVIKARAVIKGQAVIKARAVIKGQAIVGSRIDALTH
jgi:NDP-sugar pyrophosphorylase family protein